METKVLQLDVDTFNRLYTAMKCYLKVLSSDEDRAKFCNMSLKHYKNSGYCRRFAECVYNHYQSIVIINENEKIKVKDMNSFCGICQKMKNNR